MNDVRKLINLTTKDKLENFFFHKLPNTKFRLISTFSRLLKLVPLNTIRVGCRDLSLPDYFNKSKSLISFDNQNNNLCFWFCIAYYFGTRHDRCTQLAKELFKKFIGNLYSINE